MKSVTGPMGEIDMGPIMEEIREAARTSTSPGSKAAFKLQAPKEIKGDVDMLIGSQYLSVFPEPVFTTTEGLTLFKSKFLPAAEGEIACIGEPSKAFSHMFNVVGMANLISMFSRVASHPTEITPRMEYFPTALKSKALQIAAHDGDAPVGLLEQVSKEVEAEEAQGEDCQHEEPEYKDQGQVEGGAEVAGVPVHCMGCGLAFNSIDHDVKRMLDIQDLGLKLEYRCPTCRSCDNCKKGETYERVTLKQEEEQCLVRDSVWLDPETGKPKAKLPFRVDPLQHLNNNRGLALKMLDRVCQKYVKDPEVVEMIEKAFKKLHDKGFVKFINELSQEEREILQKSTIAHYIPWDVAFSGSISTPARPTFNASKNTPHGTNLNDVLAKGVPNLVNLLHIVLRWVAGPVALAGDISQFYNCVELHPDHLPFQRFVFKEGMDPKKQAMEGVIRTLIYGVRSVSAQSEEIIQLIADKVKEDYPHVAEFLIKSRYVDDLSNGLMNTAEGEEVKRDVDKVFSQHGLKVKGWCRPIWATLALI